MAGGILGFNFRTNFLLSVAKYTKGFLPYMPLYRFFAWVIMPRKNHKRSRDIFVREAQKMGRDSFSKWVDFFILLGEKVVIPKPPILYIMGDQDHLFLSEVLKKGKGHENLKIVVIPACGHVCFIENAPAFAEAAQSFLQDYGER